MITLKKAIGLGAKVSTKEGDGIVVGVCHTSPLKVDVRLLETGRVLYHRPQPEVTLIDVDPASDQTIPQEFRDWLKTRAAVH